MKYFTIIICAIKINLVIGTCTQNPQNQLQILQNVNKLLENIDKKIAKELNYLSTYINDSNKNIFVRNIWTSTTAKPTVINGRNKQEISKQEYSQSAIKQAPKGKHLKITDVVSNWLANSRLRKLKRRRVNL